MYRINQIRQTNRHLAGGVKLALIGNNLVNQSGLTFFKVAGTEGIFTYSSCFHAILFSVVKKNLRKGELESLSL
jgi:hypothetical protein